jgi:exopolyphosphatase/guanosine-5'-triphosphate,3'-diphosphate pyrophosphatase
LSGFTEEEIELIANVARYHRRSVPSSKHDAYEGLSLKRKRTVRILSAFLRVADGLDRTHFSIVDTLDVRLGKTMTIVLRVSGDAEMETWAAKGRADLLEQVFRRPVAFRVVPQEEAKR